MVDEKEHKSERDQDKQGHIAGSPPNTITLPSRTTTLTRGLDIVLDLSKGLDLFDNRLAPLNTVSLKCHHTLGSLCREKRRKASEKWGEQKQSKNAGGRFGCNDALLFKIDTLASQRGQMPQDFKRQNIARYHPQYSIFRQCGKPKTQCKIIIVTYKQAGKAIGVGVETLVVVGGEGLGNFFGGHGGLVSFCLLGKGKWSRARQARELGAKECCD